LRLNARSALARLEHFFASLSEQAALTSIETGYSPTRNLLEHRIDFLGDELSSVQRTQTFGLSAALSHSTLQK
jgi:hypothetical protein